MARILVTGATGFIGRHLVPALSEGGHEVVEAGRQPSKEAATFFAVGNIDALTDWRAALDGVDAVVHLAGLAHRETEDEAQFFAVNDAGTRRLVAACEAAGVKTVVSVSSIAAREAEQNLEPASAYGRSKLAGEAHLRHFAGEDRAGIVIRPPLVYGSDAPGNWRRLQRLAASGIPLPFAAVDNRRSLCSLGNLCSALLTAVAAGLRGEGTGVYEIADREAVSLADIVTYLRKGMARPKRLVSIPPSLLRLAAHAAGKGKLSAALFEDLTLDPSDFMRGFDWAPPEAAGDAITRSGRLYIHRQASLSPR